MKKKTTHQLRKLTGLGCLEIDRVGPGVGGGGDYQ